MRLGVMLELQLRRLLWERDATRLDPYAEREDPQWHRYPQKRITVKGLNRGARVTLPAVR